MGLFDDTEKMNQLMASPLVQMGLGMLANNRGQYAMQNALGGAGQGFAQSQEYAQQNAMNALRKQQFDMQQANRVEDRQFAVDDRDVNRGYQVADKAENRGFQVADKNEARGYQVADTNDAREFQRLQGKEQFGQQLTLQEQQFKQSFKMQNQSQGFAAGQQSRSQAFQAGENQKTRDNALITSASKFKNKGLSVAAQKELIESEDGIQGSKQAIVAFNKALSINKNAMGGFGSSTLATAGSILPEFARPSTVDATKELDNVLQGAALPQLKAIFGGMPTEGERAILLDVQGSSNQPAAVREDIFKRAIASANNRINYNTQKSKQLRDGTYFTEDGGISSDAIPPPAIAGTPAQPDYKSLAQQELARRKGKK